MTINEYREIYAAAIRNTVRLTGLTGDVDKDGAILIDRINTKRLKKDYNTDWKGDLWEGDNLKHWQRRA